MKKSCTGNGHTRSVGLQTSTTNSFNHKSHSMGQHSSQNGDKLGNFGKTFEQIQQLIYYYSFSMHFIEQIFLFMNSVFNIFIILGNRPGPILVSQRSHNFSCIMNLHLISGFPKDPIFQWSEAAFQSHADFSLEEFQMLSQLWMWPAYSIRSFLLSLRNFSLSSVCMYMSTVLWGLMDLTLCCKENGHCQVQFGFILYLKSSDPLCFCMGPSQGEGQGLVS